MPIPFGVGVGDFIATIGLVRDVINALSSSGGASASYQELIQELYSLERALLRVKQLQLDESLEGEKHALRLAASQCQSTIDEFLESVARYQPHLRSFGSGPGALSWSKDAWIKVQWHLCKEKDLTKFRARLQGHVMSIDLVMTAIQM